MLQKRLLVLKGSLGALSTHWHASCFIRFQTGGNLFKQVLYYTSPSMGERRGTALTAVRDTQQPNCEILNANGIPRSFCTRAVRLQDVITLVTSHNLLSSHNSEEN